MRWRRSPCFRGEVYLQQAVSQGLIVETEVRLFCQILDSIEDDYILVVNQERRIFYVNQPFLKHFSYRREEIIGKLCYEMSRPFHEPCTAAQGQCPLENTLSLGTTQKTILTRNWEGKKLSYEAMFYPLKEDGRVTPLMVVGVFRDITTKRQLEQELRHRLEFESHLIRISIDGIVANDRPGHPARGAKGVVQPLFYYQREGDGLGAGHLPTDHRTTSGRNRHRERSRSGDALHYSIAAGQCTKSISPNHRIYCGLACRDYNLFSSLKDVLLRCR
ncbi:MAG: hypothetical protein DRG58_07755 [Deltaproteobacteria bacterium]|nr:MAG: hypothetical protein DRG58_07755 [Deltaproteobacteria bacterium]